MNDSSNTSSVRGALYHQGPAEALAPYPGQMHSVQIPRSIGQPSLQMDPRGSVAVANGYRGLAAKNSSGDSGLSSTYATGARDSRSQQFEGLQISSLRDTANPRQESHGDDIANANSTGFAARISTPFDRPIIQNHRSESNPQGSSEYIRMGRDAKGHGQQIEPNPLVSKMKVNGSSMSPPPNPYQAPSGQKRNAVGEIKNPSIGMVAPHVPGLDGSVRHRSRSIGSGSHENRIAALSMHLRNRLSYAAAKVERSRQSRHAQSTSPLRSLQGVSPAAPSIYQTNISCIEGNGSPEGTTVSAPDPPATYNFHPPNDNGSARSPEMLSTSNSHATHSTSQQSPKKFFPVPKLAPPVDIITSGGSGRRRRPNPNEFIEPPQSNQSFSHRRHHSQQEFGIFKQDPDYRMIPGTPPLRPTYPESTPYNGASKLQPHPQNSSMEQDAIETLMFMSSPENSGYRSNGRHQNTIPNSIDSSMKSSSSANGSQNHSLSSHMDCDNGPPAFPGSRSQSQFNGLEAHAGDEIDRMLDQMGDSDSEDEKGFTPGHFRSRTLPVNSARGLSGI